MAERFNGRQCGEFWQVLKDSPEMGAKTHSLDHNLSRRKRKQTSAAIPKIQPLRRSQIK